MINKSISFNLPVMITKQGRRFVAYSPALDISTSGKNEKEAQKRFSEIAGIFLEEIIDAGNVNEVLLELGWKKAQKVWNPPQVVSSRYIGIRIPAFA